MAKKKNVEEELLGKEPVSDVDNDGNSDLAVADVSVKEHAADEVGIAIKKDAEKESVEEDKRVYIPNLFVEDEDIIEIEVEVLFDYKDGKVFSVARKGLLSTAISEESLGLARVEYKAVFSPVNYDNLTMYRRAAQFYDPQSKTMVINRQTMRNVIFVNHLKEWNVPGRNGQVVKLDHDDENGTLTVECANRIFKAIPSLIDVIMTIFEQKLMTTLGTEN